MEERFMKCPVCETEYMGYEKCPQCGFDQLNKLFATKDETDAWTKQVVEPYRASYLFSPKVFAEAKRKACATRTNESLDEFYKAFAALVEHDTWVNAPTNGNQLVIVPFRGGHYIAIYSDMNGRAPGDSKDVISTDINKFIDVLYDNPNLLGIVIDPNKEPLLINRKSIHFHTKRKDPRLQAKDWGPGIPKFNPKDLMTAEELLDFGMDVVIERYISKNGFNVIETHKGTQGFPNFALKKEGVVYLMKVAVGVNNKPVLAEQDKEFYLSSCKRFNAKCLYAPLALISCDDERAANGIALYGDRYYVDFSDVEELN
jgi:hypothetical protein